MDGELQKDLIEFFDWVKQWYYTPESLAKIEAMKARVAAQQSRQAEVCPMSEDGRHHYYQDFEPGHGVIFDCICGKRR